MSTIGHHFPEAQQPINPRFMKRCSTCSKDGNPLIDPTTREGRLAKDLGNGSYQCLACQTREIEDIQLKIDPHGEKAKQIIYKRIREMEEKLKQDEINHIRKQNRVKITVKSPNL